MATFRESAGDSVLNSPIHDLTEAEQQNIRKNLLSLAKNGQDADFLYDVLVGNPVAV